MTNLANQLDYEKNPPVLDKTADKTMKHIIWPIDAFEQPNENQNLVSRLLNLINEDGTMRIEPLSIFNSDGTETIDETNLLWHPEHKPAFANLIKQFLKQNPIKNLTEPKLMFEPHTSTKSAIKSLVSYAKSTDTDLIVMGTHGRKGLPRIVLGSFAETLLLYSNIPMLIIGPQTSQKTTLPAQFKKAIFATDFSDASLAAYQKFLIFAKKLKLQVTLLHGVPSSNAAVVQSGVYLLGGGWVPATDVLHKQKKTMDGIAQDWKNIARDQAVETQFVLDIDATAITESIFKHSENLNCDLIALAAQSSNLSSIFLGSICLQVIRNAPLPVWVCRAK